MPLARAGLVAACAAMLMVGGCGQAAQTTPGPSAAITQQQCVQAVFNVLRGMASKPYDAQPFESFVTTYGTQSVTYDAYLDVFTSFNTLSANNGVQRAETRLLPTVSRDCSPGS
ncbi:MAG TPA: hypothetical protein VFX16_15935 [Pseudonocardiaceae bacterium]|nr:hypothetical protein [Pseudonocardiaceae bacterium]